MAVENDLRDVRDQVIAHLPPAPDTTRYFLRRAAASAASTSNGGAAGVGAVVSADSAPSVSSGGPLLPGEPPAPSASPGPGSGRALSGDVAAIASSCDTDAGSIGTTNGVSATEDACFPGDVCSSASDLLGAVDSDAAASYSETSGNCKSTAGPVTCEPRAFPEEAVSLIFSHLPIKSIFRVGYLFSKKWLQIWQGIPLVLHDMQLAPDHAREGIRNGDMTALNLAKKVSQVIDMHPGPIELFRVDFSTWRGGNSLQWRVWLQKLINKNVQKIIICGRWPMSPMEALPNNLVYCKSLQKIHLCFFSMPRIGENLVLPCLKELRLYHCVFESSDLDSILRGCKLTELNIGYVKLGILRIESETLRIFAMWSCNIDILCLSGTPSLTFFSQEPQWTWDHRSHLQLRGIPKLRVLSSIFLNQQTVELCGYLMKADMLDYPLCWSVARLELVVDFAYLKGLALIPSLLRCFPNLKTLRISRLDILDSNERYTGPAIDWHGMLSTIPCINTNLNTFVISNALGDDVEYDLAEAVSGCAEAIKKVQVYLHPKMVQGDPRS